MKEPWFERWGLVGYRPINRQGRITLALMAGAFALLSFGYLEFEDDPFVSVICGTGAVAAALIGHWLVFTRMADPKWRR